MKYLLFRPRGGFNDILNTIYLCLEYCRKYNRILLIQTLNKYSTYNFNFSDIFEFIDPTNIIYNNDDIIKIISNDKLTIFPKFLPINYYDYRIYSIKINTKNIPIIEYNKNKVTIEDVPLNVMYDEDVIIYPFNDGGIKSHDLIKLLILREKYTNDIIEKYNKIPKPYVSIHIRNTDFKCDYKSFYEQNKEKINESNIFLATDSIDVLNYFKSLNLKIFTFTKLPDNNIPYHFSNIDNSEKILNSISDLFLLGLGNDFLVPLDKKGGYTRLAFFLYQNKDILLKILDNKL